MIFILQGGLYDILKKEPTHVINDFTVEYKDNVFIIFRINDYILNNIINKYSKEEALRIVSGGILSSQLNNPKINYIVDYPCFTTDELSGAISTLYWELRDSILYYTMNIDRNNIDKKDNKNKIDLFQKEFNIKDEVIKEAIKREKENLTSTDSSMASYKSPIEVFIRTISVGESLYEDVLNILEKNNFKYIDIFKKRNTYTGGLWKKEYKRSKEKNYNDLDRNLYDILVNTYEFKRDVLGIKDPKYRV